MERMERSTREKELSDQRVKSLESSMEAVQAAHLESRFNSELIQRRVQDLEAAVAVERTGQQEAQCSLELLRAKFREVERAYGLERDRGDGTERALERLQAEYKQYKSEQDVALETERITTSDLSGRLEEEKRRHADTLSLLQQAATRQRDREEAFGNCLEQIREMVQQHRNTDCSPPAKHDGSRSPSTEVLQLLKTTLDSYQHRLGETEKQVRDLMLASERLQEENQALRQLTSDQSRQMEESRQVTVKLEEEVTRLRQESSDWATQSRVLQAELQKEREREREDRVAEVQKITEHYQEESKACLSFLYRVYQRLLAGCVLLDQPHSILGSFTWAELCDVISEQVDQLTSDLLKANDKIAKLQSVCEKKSACVRELQRSQECVLFRLEESVRRREEAWSSQHTQAVTQLQNELQVTHTLISRSRLSLQPRRRSELSQQNAAER
uniref:Coiled-coil domain containing 171 n=1 Tax=Monopterus albus TaxID=43700 RepID=A0A3Q3J511_MONAL